MPTAATKPRFVRRAVGAVVLPAEQYDAWYALATQTPGLNAIEIGALAAVCENFRHLHERGWGARLSYDRMAHDLDVGPVRIKWAVYHLVELGLLGVERGRGGQVNEYRPCLPRRLAAGLAPAEAAPPL